MKYSWLLFVLVVLSENILQVYGASTFKDVKVINMDHWSYKLYHFFINHPIELAGVAFIIFYIGYFIWGMKKNAKISKTWLNEYLDLFKQEFTSVGISGTKGLFINVSHDEYRFFCSGREHCLGLLADCKTKKRQDFYSFLIELISPVEDILTIDVPLDHQTAAPFVLALCRKKDVRSIHNQFKDLKDLTHQVSSQYIPELSKQTNNFVVLCDNNEIPSQVVTKKLAMLLNNDKDYFRLLHISDKKTENLDGSPLLSTYLLRFKFRIPPPDKISELNDWMNYIFVLIDQLPTLSLSSQSRSVAVEARIQADQRDSAKEHKERQALLQAKKEQRVLQEKEQYKYLSPEEKKKYDEKQEQEELKKKLKRRIVKG